MTGSDAALVRVRKLGRNYAIGIRVVTSIPIGIVAVIVADQRAPVLVALTVLAGSSVISVLLLCGGRGSIAAVVDTIVLVAIGLLTTQLTPMAWLIAGWSWIRPFVTFAAVGIQYSTPARIGLPLGVLVCTAAASSAAAAAPGPLGIDAVVTVVWSNVIPLLARMLFTLLERSARRADAAVDEADRLRRDRLVAAGARAEEIAVANSLHDTAATTLLMVGLGAVEESDEVFRRRVRKDVWTLRSIRSNRLPDVSADLANALRDVVSQVGLNVSITGNAESDLPPHVVRAFTDAVREALTNVARHAGITSARLVLSHDQSSTNVEVHDEGHGFDSECVPPTRRGVRASIIARMEGVGGTASIESRPAQGTSVRLRWAP